MRKYAGLMSMVLIGAGIIVGLVFLSLMSLTLGGIYCGIAALSIYSVLMNYCRKCPHSMNNSCQHVLPGRIAKRLPYKKTGKYTVIELTLVILSILTTFIFPIIYIYGQWLRLAIYLALWLIGALLLRIRVCPNCYNRWCVVCPNRVK